MTTGAATARIELEETRRLYAKWEMAPLSGAYCNDDWTACDPITLRLLDVYGDMELALGCIDSEHYEAVLGLHPNYVSGFIGALDRGGELETPADYPTYALGLADGRAHRALLDTEDQP